MSHPPVTDFDIIFAGGDTTACVVAGRLATCELKAIGPAFQARWEEFFQHRPDKAVAIFAVFAGYFLRHGLPPRNYMDACYFTLYPTSVDSVHIKLGENGKEELNITAGYLDDPSDIVPLNFAYKKTREIFRRMPSYQGEASARHPRFLEGSAAACGEASGPVELNAPDIIYSAEDDEAIDKYHIEHGNAIDMALARDLCHEREADQGVVDARLNVYGVTNLKVADMSIAPLNVGTNMCSTALLIREKAAVMIAEKLGIGCTAFPDAL